MSACFLSLKSMQFCSLTKFESLQSKAEKELAELQKQMSMKLSSISESHLSVSNKMSSQIELLSTKNSKYKVSKIHHHIEFSQEGCSDGGHSHTFMC